MSFMKQLKRRFRLRRLLFPISMVLLGLLVITNLSTPADNDENMESPVYAPVADPNGPQSIDLSKDHREYTVLKKLRYVCGEETKELGVMSGKAIDQLLDGQEQLELTWGSDGQAILYESIDDLSPACKGNVYFSMDNQGNLTLFDGEPEAGKVLQTFFQIDIQYLESSLPRDAVQSLYDGIQIHDYASYNSVLSTYASYAVEAEPH